MGTLPGLGLKQTLTGCYSNFLKHTRVSFVIEPARFTTDTIEKAEKRKREEKKDVIKQMTHTQKTATK